MKRSRIIKASGIFFAAVGALLIAAGAIMQYRYSKNGRTGNVISETFEFEVPRELVVITTSMPVSVSYGDTEKVTVSYTGSLPLIFTEDKSGLHITQNDTFTMTLFSARAAGFGVNITLPHKIYERISISSSSGSVESLSLGADTLEFSTKSGDMRLMNIDERASVRTESGNVYAEFSSFSGDMTINAGAGDVTLLLPPELSLFLEFYTDSGSFTSEYFDEDFFGKRGDAAVIYNGAAYRLNVNTTSGDLIIL